MTVVRDSKLSIANYSPKESNFLLNTLIYKPVANSGGLSGTASRTQMEPKGFAIVTLHGSEGHAMGGINLWLAPYLTAECGYAVVCPNKRNSGSRYYTSLFDWCEEDIQKLLDFMTLNQKLSEKTVLIGHSLGACEAVYYQAKTHDKRVIGLVLLSPPLWPRKVIDEDKLKIALEHQNDKPTYFIGSDQGGVPVSALHYASYWSKDSNNNISKWIPSLNVPILVVSEGTSLNEMCNPQAGREIAHMAVERGKCPKVNYEIIQGAPHSFRGYFGETATLIGKWLCNLG